MTRNARTLLAFFAIAAASVAADQALKLWVIENMTLHRPSIPLIPGWFALTRTHNYGASWSMFWGQTGFLLAISAAISVGIVFYVVSLTERTWAQTVAFALVLGGALGNLIDRARLGYVVDMFDLQYQGRNWFPIFNIADVCIDTGVGLLLLLSFLEGRRRKASASEEPSAPAPPGAIEPS